VTVLLDANVLIALLVDDHVHHVAAENWFVGTSGTFATCPITQGSLMRLLIREGQSAATAQAVLAGATGDARHEFWPDDVGRARGSRLATFDQAMAKLHNDVADLIPDS
jgi:predicted nucleic acid-binding protein